MKSLAIKVLFWGSILIFLFAIAYYCLLKFQNADIAINGLISVIGLIANLWTIALAIILYDRFGLDAKGKERQLDLILQLNRDLTRTRGTFKNGDGTLINLPFSRRTFKDLNHVVANHFIEKHVCIVTDDYFTFLERINNIEIQSWLPKEILEKIKALDFNEFQSGLQNPDTATMFSCASFAFNNADWVRIVPEITVLEFLTRFGDLLDAVGIWLSKANPDIKLPV